MGYVIVQLWSIMLKENVRHGFKQTSLGGTAGICSFAKYNDKSAFYFSTKSLSNPNEKAQHFKTLHKYWT